MGNKAQKLAKAAETRDWKTVKSLAKNDGLKHEELQFLAEEYNKMQQPDAETEDVFKFVIMECSGSKIRALLPQLIEMGLWRSVDLLLIRKTDSELKRRAVAEASRRADGADLARILIHCVDDQFDDVFKLAVDRGLWSAVTSLMRRERKGWWSSSSRVSVAQREWALTKAIQGAGDAELSEIALQCVAHDNLQEKCLKHAVIRGLWDVVSGVLKRELQQLSNGNKGLTYFLAPVTRLVTCSPGQHDDWPDNLRWAVTEGCKRADEDVLIKHFLPYCAQVGLTDLVLKKLIKRKLWQAAACLLQQSNDHKQDEQDTSAIEPRSSPDSQGFDMQFDFIVNEALRREMWSVLKALHQHGFNEEQLKAVGEKATERAGLLGLPLDSSRHGPKDKLLSLLELLATTSDRSQPPTI
nr:hypothetical protein BaRGS_017982 [Batillaria attramentaria]